ncbi:tRNA dihydrouridine(20/20a) synthase DusA [Basilea psittacipulmonis]|uniref:tRNA-dihydrouridine(20/20a) synthase n=1 Tax=Basilea psittacipulmonis DSM 24701 TaxID=1072685 RepID=A0A077DI09_9BURK|nr:tRNA dihydrouridine(20/20a) synthase DusA [Basilea psittacipulmonis]AIL33162.1 tRNA-dihydrouridine synthase A [Basilea psittacipulmonis DSM 24701]
MSNLYSHPKKPWQLSVAPMLDVTNRHCRYFHRLLAPNALLYTEMVTTGALIYGDIDRHLKFNAEEHPVALQLGGSDPAHLAQCAKLAETYGYDEVNLNCGCPSDRVQKGAFGACLMKNPQLVADCFKAMRDACSLDVTIKHRIGIDDEDSYEFVQDFVGTLYEAGCRVFITHARKAILQGLSPKENRDIPPLKYEVVQKLKNDFPDAIFVLNGGIKTTDAISEHLKTLDGVMIGRSAWHEPYILREAHRLIWPETAVLSDDEIIEQIIQYADRCVHEDIKLRYVIMPILGLFNGQKGAKLWRRILSDNLRLQANDITLIRDAYQAIKYNMD